MEAPTPIRCEHDFTAIRCPGQTVRERARPDGVFECQLSRFAARCGHKVDLFPARHQARECDRAPIGREGRSVVAHRRRGRGGQSSLFARLDREQEDAEGFPLRNLVCDSEVFPVW
jgi:hypothetical protein